MKTILIVLLSLLLAAAYPAYGAEVTTFGEYTCDSLTITSYSPSWDNSRTEQLYHELQNNFISSEYSLLSHIYIYPDSPSGLNGEYFEDISISGGKYTVGGGAYINLYNGERYTTIEEMAPILSHEYGHHYTIVNILKTEGKYYSNWQKTRYGKIRDLDKYKNICCSRDDPNYVYRWDVTEIAANDYYQLLGSPTGKASLDYPDTTEMLEIKRKDRINGTNTAFDKTAYNAMPQKNPDIPLAANIDGLYQYLLEIGGYTGQNEGLSRYPALTEITYKDTPTGRQYTVNWSKAAGSGPFEYTLIMYGKGSSLIPQPVKTVAEGESLTAVFGSGTNGTDTIERDFIGEYEFVLYTRDSRGFIYSSKPTEYNFSTAKNITTYVRYPLRDGTMTDVFNAIHRILQREGKIK